MYKNCFKIVKYTVAKQDLRLPGAIPIMLGGAEGVCLTFSNTHFLRLNSMNKTRVSFPLTHSVINIHRPVVCLCVLYNLYSFDEVNDSKSLHDFYVLQYLCDCKGIQNYTKQARGEQC